MRSIATEPKNAEGNGSVERTRRRGHRAGDCPPDGDRVIPFPSDQGAETTVACIPHPSHSATIQLEPGLGSSSTPGWRNAADPPVNTARSNATPHGTLISRGGLVLPPPAPTVGVVLAEAQP